MGEHVYLRPIEAAKYLNLSKSHLAFLRQVGQGPDYIRLSAAGRTVVYRRADLDRWAAKARTPGNVPIPRKPRRRPVADLSASA
jgi:hypothetical protein